MPSAIILLQALPQSAAESALTSFIRTGLLGSATVLLAWVVLHLYGEAKRERTELMLKIEQLQSKQVTDAQKTTADVVLALTNTSHSVDAQTQASKELRDALRELEIEVRRGK